MGRGHKRQQCPGPGQERDHDEDQDQGHDEDQDRTRTGQTAGPDRTDSRVSVSNEAWISGATLLEISIEHMIAVVPAHLAKNAHREDHGHEVANGKVRPLPTAKRA